MIAPAKFTDFLEKISVQLEQIKESLLRHENNPKDREFLNDIARSVRVIKTAAMPVGLGRTSELCFHLDNFLDRLCREKITITDEHCSIIADCRNRLAQFANDIETSGAERGMIKDMLKRIQQATETAQTESVREPATKKTVTSARPAAGSSAGEASSLLPDEIKKQEYDPELFQIFIEQMQENLSLLRAITDGWSSAPSKDKSIFLSSEVVNKLQTSANYMGYDKLAEYYGQWKTDLESAGVALSKGKPESFDFMDKRIKTIVGLFPQIQDKPASSAALLKAELESPLKQPAPSKTQVKPKEEVETASLKDLFSGMDEGEDEALSEKAAPIAALSSNERPARQKKAEPPPEAADGSTRKKRMQAPLVEIDSKFLEDERQGPEFDEELFQIFVQQLKEHLVQVRSLVDEYPKAKNKGSIVNQCSTLVGKLQNSANYMGYEPLVEFYLQWIAELEMAGVDLSLGSPVSFDFMDQKIRKLGEIFPQVRDVATPSVPGPQKPAADASVDTGADETQGFKELFIGLDEDEDEVFDEDSVPIAALSSFDEDSGWQEQIAQAAEADLPEVVAFFGETEEKRLASKSKDKREHLAEAEPIAALSESEDIAVAHKFAELDDIELPELDTFFDKLGVAPAAPTPQQVEAEEDVDKIFGGEEPAPALSGAEDIPEEEFPAAPAEAQTKVDALFADFGEDEDEEEVSFEFGSEPIAALSEEEAEPPAPEPPTVRKAKDEIEALFAEEEGEATDTRARMAEDIEELFTAAAGGDDLDFEPDDDESLTALADSAIADLQQKAAPVPPPRKKLAEPMEDLVALFGDEEEEPGAAAEEPVLEAEPVAPPGREELFRKLSDALKSMDEEVPTLEAVMDKAKAEAARTSSEQAKARPDVSAAEEERQLFTRLLGALESTAEDDDRGAAKPIDQVIEEILAGEAATATAPAQEPEPEPLPVQITPPDVRQSYNLDPEGMDNLMDRIGELATGRSTLSKLYDEMSSLHHRLRDQHILKQSELTPLELLLQKLEDTTSALNRVSSDIMDGVIKVRMVPAGQLFSLYQDVVNCMALKDSKQVEFVITGEDTKIDQFTIEDIADCLLHLISNAVSHGIESAETRQQSGKNPAGTLTLNAVQEANHVVIEVTDDGCGIDTKAIKASALAKEMFSSDELYRMSDEDLAGLLTAPGFTTSPGVAADASPPGLDRVRATIEKLGGRVRIITSVGQGTTVRLAIPLKLPTYRSLKVRVGDEVFALPLHSIEEIVRVTPEALILNGEAERIAFRQDSIQLYSLAGLAGMEPAAPHGERFPAVVINTDAGPVGLIVDETLGLAELSVKPLTDYLRRHGNFAGAAIKGEDNISYIPDVAGLMKNILGSARI